MLPTHMVANDPTVPHKLLYVGPPAETEPTELERIASAIADLSDRFAVVEELLERYRPLLAMAESRMSGGFGRLKRGVPRGESGRET